MTDLVTMNVVFSNIAGTLIGDVTVVGAGDELFRSAVARAVREQLDPDYSGQPAGIGWYDPDYPEYLHMIVPDGTTMAAAREYFGDEADASPPTIRVDEGGYGGAPDFIAYAIELVSSGMAVAGLVSTTLQVQRGITKARYHRFRQLAKDWNDSDYISPDLREAVMIHNPWPRSDFDKTFGLSESRGPQLLRELGYTPRNYDWGQQWQRPWEEE